jgi:hypothetical protein
MGRLRIKPEPEQYTPERKVEFLLSNAIDKADYRKTRMEARELGIDPDTVPHVRPKWTTGE